MCTEPHRSRWSNRTTDERKMRITKGLKVRIYHHGHSYPPLSCLQGQQGHKLRAAWALLQPSWQETACSCALTPTLGSCLRRVSALPEHTSFSSLSPPSWQRRSAQRPSTSVGPACSHRPPWKMHTPCAAMWQLTVPTWTLLSTPSSPPHSDM